MELSLETIAGIITLILGSGGIGTWIGIKTARRKAEAEAKLAEAEALKAEVEAKKVEVEVAKEHQDYYQQLTKDLAEDREDRKKQNDELRAERDHYKQERNELREVVDKVNLELRDLKKAFSDKDIENDQKIARLGRKVDAMRPLLCGEMSCTRRRLVIVSDNGDVKDAKKGGKS